MKFFLEGATDDGQADEVWGQIRRFAGETLGWAVSNRRIFRIRYRHDGIESVVEVGEREPRTGALVLAILESNAYLVCTLNRGVRSGEPILIGLNEALHVEDFDSPSV